MADTQTQRLQDQVAECAALKAEKDGVFEEFVKMTKLEDAGCKRIAELQEENARLREASQMALDYFVMKCLAFEEKYSICGDLEPAVIANMLTDTLRAALGDSR